MLRSMPVEVTTLTLAQRPLAERILEFLRGSPGKAFDTYEVYAAMQGLTEQAALVGLLLATAASRGSDDPSTECRSTLEQLVADGKLARATYKGRPYYFVRTP
jgi:hypothetical protein